jgi:hypothetical protein
MMLKRQVLFWIALWALLGGACAHHETTRPVAGNELKRVTQLDLRTNQPIRSWNARADTIKQHFAPPVGITFVDADTGQTVHFDGTFRIESYQPATESAPLHPPPARSP